MKKDKNTVPKMVDRKKPSKKSISAQINLYDSIREMEIEAQQRLTSIPVRGYE